MKKACAKYLAWRAAKGMTLALGCLQYRKSNEAEKLIMWAIVKGRNLISVSILDKSGYSCTFENHKSEVLDVFKVFKAEVELQLGEQRPGPFDLYLEECGIVPQYTMSGTTSMNGVAERRNHTLQDMVRSMIQFSTLPKSLWGEAIKISANILNRRKRDNIIQRKRNWIPQQLVVTLLVLKRSRGVIEDSTANQEGNPDSHSEHVEPQEQFHEKSQEPPVPLKRSTREKKSAIFDDFVVFIHEHEDGIWMMDDPLSVCQAIKSVDSDEWTDAMNE
ncbi:hypothetical protein YC2023_121947 [Brassica napus]